MTRQISDALRFRSHRHVVAGATSSPFDPAAHGFVLAAQPVSTCWRGYWCEYEVRDDRLLLTHLRLWLHELADAAPFGGRTPRGRAEYENLEVRLQYSGSIFLGRFAPRELVFDDGRLVRSRSRLWLPEVAFHPA